MYELTKYRHEINADGDMVIFDVPIFAENIRWNEGSQKFDHFDENWCKAAVKEGFQRYIFDNYQYSWHLGHHTPEVKRLGITLPKIGRFIPKKTEYRLLKGEKKCCVISDLIVNKKNIPNIKEYSNLSIEVKDPDYPEITSLASLPDGTPEHQFSTFTVSSPVVFSKQEGNSIYFQLNEDLMIDNQMSQQNFGLKEIAKKLAGSKGAYDRFKAKVMNSPIYDSTMKWLNDDIQAGSGRVYDSGWISPDSLASYMSNIDPQKIQAVLNLAQSALFEGDDPDGVDDQQNFGIGEIGKKIASWARSRPDEAADPSKLSAWGNMSESTKAALRKIASLRQSGRLDENQVISVLENAPPDVSGELRRFAGNFGPLLYEKGDNQMDGLDTLPKENEQSFEGDTSPGMEGDSSSNPKLESVMSMLSGLTDEMLDRVIDLISNLQNPDPLNEIEATEGVQAFSKGGRLHPAIKQLVSDACEATEKRVLAQMQPFLQEHESVNFEKSVKSIMGERFTNESLQKAQIFAKKHGKGAALDYVETLSGGQVPTNLKGNFSGPSYNTSPEDLKQIQLFEKRGVPPEKTRKLLSDYHGSLHGKHQTMSFERYVELQTKNVGLTGRKTSWKTKRG